MARKALSKKLRFEIFKRDGFVCQYCGAHPPSAVLHVDHIDPVKLGGTNHPDNLITACQACNQGKAATPLDAVPQSLADRAADVAEKEAQVAGYARVMETRRERIEGDTWDVAEMLSPGAREGYSRKRFASIKMFVERLGYHGALDAAEITSAKFFSGQQAFKYFCGVCWSKIREQNDG